MICIKCKAELTDGSLYCNYCGKKQEQTRGKSVRRRGNGQGTSVKRGKYWTSVAIVGWRWDNTDPDHPVKRRVTRTKGGFKTKSDALDYIPILRNEKPKGPTTLESLYTIWKDNSMVKLSKSKQTAYHIAYNKIKEILYCDIATLTIGQLQTLSNEKAPSYYTRKDIKTLLSHLYDMAVAQGDAPTNLAEFIELPTLDEKEQTPFDANEQNSLWKDYAAGNRFTGYILLMIYTGMMPGELFDARKDMVDFSAHTIIGCGKKTKKRKQTPLVICDIIEPVLHDLIENTPGDKLLRINRDNFYFTFRETLSRCGCRPLTPYSCRHTTATALALQDIPPSVIQEVMRHTKFSTTQRYIHVNVAPMLDAVNKLGKTDGSCTQ